VKQARPSPKGEKKYLRAFELKDGKGGDGALRRGKRKQGMAGVKGRKYSGQSRKCGRDSMGASLQELPPETPRRRSGGNTGTK